MTPRPRFVMPEADLPDPPAWEDDAFGRGPARRPFPVVRAPTLQWASGLPTTGRAIFAGWLCEREWDTELDAAMERAGVTSTTIRHGGGALVNHWTLPTVSLFLIAEGVQSLHELRETSERYGIAFWWTTLPNSMRQSHLRCRVLARELLTVGYDAPLTLSVKSTLTGDLIAALVQQYAVLDAAAILWGRTDLPFFAFSLPIGVGAEVTRGNGGQARTLVPMVAGVPKPIDEEYLAAQWTTQAWAERVEGLLDATVAWSREMSRQMAQEEGHDVARC
jgi:hypothetical protein